MWLLDFDQNSIIRQDEDKYATGTQEPWASTPSFYFKTNTNIGKTHEKNLYFLKVNIDTN